MVSQATDCNMRTSSTNEDNSKRAAGTDAPGRTSTSGQRLAGSRVPETALLTAQVEAAIRRLTGDRVRGLRVTVQAETIRIEGRCATFYCKQLAQQAALELMCQETLVNHIEVY